MEREIEPIGPENLRAVIKLLEERNGTLPGYTRWKYSDDGHEKFRGVLARNDGEVAGCVGVVPRTLVLHGRDVVECGWFADWYVSPPFRETGVGRRMLEAITHELPLVFGHPGPSKA